VIITFVLAFFIAYVFTGPYFSKQCNPVALRYKKTTEKSFRNLMFEGSVRRNQNFLRNLPQGFKVTSIVSSYNHVENIPHIAFPLSHIDAIEQIIAVDDASQDDSYFSWKEHLTRKYDMVLLTNGIHQLRSYNLAASIAKGDILLFMHDDDLLPSTKDVWLYTALSFFQSHPRLCVLGGLAGEMTPGWEFGEEETDNSESYTYQIPFLNPDTKIPFMFVSAVWSAPLFIRSSCWRELGPFEEKLAPIGEPAIWLDVEYSLRAWTNGWQVGLFHAPFKRGVGGHGTLRTEEKASLRHHYLLQNQRFVQRKYGDERNHWFLKESMDLNEQLLLRRDGEQSDYSRLKIVAEMKHVSKQNIVINK